MHEVTRSAKTCRARLARARGLDVVCRSGARETAAAPARWRRRGKRSSAQHRMLLVCVGRSAQIVTARRTTAWRVLRRAHTTGQPARLEEKRQVRARVAAACVGSDLTLDTQAAPSRLGAECAQRPAAVVAVVRRAALDYARATDRRWTGPFGCRRHTRAPVMALSISRNDLCYTSLALFARSRAANDRGARRGIAETSGHDRLLHGCLRRRRYANQQLARLTRVTTVGWPS